MASSTGPTMERVSSRLALKFRGPRQEAASDPGSEVVRPAECRRHRVPIGHGAGRNCHIPKKRISFQRQRRLL